MKTTAFKLTIIFLLFSGIQANSQQNTIKLKLNEGYEYIYKIRTETIRTISNNSTNKPSIHDKTIQIIVDKVLAEHVIEITAQYLENRFSKEEFGIKYRWDYFYPDFYEFTPNPDEEFFSKLNFQYSLDLKCKTISLLNWEELLDQYFNEYSKLNGYKKDDHKLKAHLREKLLAQGNIIEFLLWFNGDTYQQNGVLNNKLLRSNFDVSIENDGIIKLHCKEAISDTSKIQVFDYSYDSKLGLPSKCIYQTIGNEYPYSLIANKTFVTLCRSREIQAKSLFIQGEFTKSLSKKISIAFLNKPFGNDLYMKTFDLDENGKFEAHFDYSHEGFVFAINEDNNKYNFDERLMFYASPGDTIEFNALGSSFQEDITFSGNRSNEAELINKICNSLGIFRAKIIDGTIKKGFLSIRYEHLQIPDYLSEIEKVMSGYKSVLDQQAYNFIENEFKAACYLRVYDYLSFIFNKSSILNLPNPLDITNREEYEKLISSHDIHTKYNEYGFFSRFLAHSYLIYHFKRAKFITRDDDRSFLFGSSHGMEKLVGFAPMVLYGSPLYQETATLLTKKLYDNINIQVPFSSRNELFIARQLETLKNRCNNAEFLAEIGNVLNNLSNWKDENYVPKEPFLNTKKEEIRLSDYFGEKPNIFYVSNNWSVERYVFDRKASEETAINFTMVMEGSNFREWEDYMSRAEPVANQLLLLNDTLTLKDLFPINNRMYFIYDKHGKYLGNEVKLNSAIQLAKESLHEKKETDKSTLQLIILILGIVLVLFTITALIWRWRVRQRFKVEEQKRKLRELELTAIRSQMNPHFLFNSLNSVQNLIQQNKGREAHLYLAEFAGLIRKVLHNSEKEEISLAEELEMVKQYLSLEKLRFEFDFVIHVDEEIDSYNTLIPSMLLQPFAENAVVHGFQFKSGIKNNVTKNNASFSNNGRIEIRVSRVKQSILISIEDNGVGRKIAEKISASTNGKGTKMIEQRLKILQEKQGEKYQLEIIDLEGKEKSGTRVQILIPEEV